MRPIVLCLVTFISLAMVNTVWSSESTLQSLVDAERAFAKASLDHGTDHAFLANLADDSILFRPGPVNGKEWFKAHPAPPTMLLTWGPAHADISSAGDLGYTTGGWEIRPERKLDATPVAFGHFVSVWRRVNGVWKVELDTGISHGKPSTPTQEWTSPAAPAPSARTFSDKALAVSLLDADRAFAEKASTKSNLDAYKGMMSESVRLYRDKMLPAVGKAGALEVVKKGPKTTEWKPEQSGVSKSKDMGYTLGSYYASGATADGSDEEGYYVRIWKRDGDGTWRVVLDIVNPKPPAS